MELRQEFVIADGQRPDGISVNEAAFVGGDDSLDTVPDA